MDPILDLTRMISKADTGSFSDIGKHRNFNNRWTFTKWLLLLDVSKIHACRLAYTSVYAKLRMQPKVYSWIQDTKVVFLSAITNTQVSSLRF